MSNSPDPSHSQCCRRQLAGTGSAPGAHFHSKMQSLEEEADRATSTDGSRVARLRGFQPQRLQDSSGGAIPAWRLAAHSVLGGRLGSKLKPAAQCVCTRRQTGKQPASQTGRQRQTDNKLSVVLELRVSDSLGVVTSEFLRSKRRAQLVIAAVGQVEGGRQALSTLEF